MLLCGIMAVYCVVCVLFGMVVLYVVELCTVW